MPGERGPLVTLPVQSEHAPSRPTWGCRACGRDWPCAGARGDLILEYRFNPTALSILMASLMHNAIDDLTAYGEGSPTDLFERFLAWTRPALTSEQANAAFTPNATAKPNATA